VKLEQSFEVEAPIDRVWAALIDVEHVAPCLPGAAVTGQNEDGSYTGTITIKIGPTTANYAGKLEMKDVDESARTAVMHAHGTDRRGQGGATATISSTLREQGTITHVDVVTDYHITGRLARFGRGGMIEDVSKRMLREFSKRLQDSLTGHDAVPEAEPAPAAAAEAPAATTEAAAAESGPVAGAGATAEAGATAQAPPSAANGSSPEGGSIPPRTPPGHQHHHVEPIQGLSLAGGVIVDTVKRNPLPVVVTLLLALLVVRRRGGASAK
jgi:carbon monoxide dehydrogenase subunit G